MVEKIDLHLHTNLSDGFLSPLELIELCVNVEGCEKIAITDHDKMSDYSEYSKIYNIPIISGIEFNSSTKGMHILGYWPEYVEVISDIMSEIARENQDVCHKVIDALYSGGYDISLEKVLGYVRTLGIPVDYLNKKHIVRYLIYKGYAKGTLDAYNSLIGVGQKYYYPIKKLTKYDVLNIIKSNGGVAVLAHPSTLGLDDELLNREVKHLMNYGLDGIEIKNRSITEEQSIKYELVASSLGLLTTVGSDFHCPGEDSIGVMASSLVFDNLKKRMKVLRK